MGSRKRRRILHCEVEMTENTSRIFTETMLALYDKYKDRLSVNKNKGGVQDELQGKGEIEEGDSGQDS